MLFVYYEVGMSMYTLTRVPLQGVEMTCGKVCVCISLCVCVCAKMVTDSLIVGPDSYACLCRVNVTSVKVCWCVCV